MKKPKFYSLRKIVTYDSIYNMIIGERSNGKTFAVLERILKNYLNNGSQGAVIRRWSDDFKRHRGQQMFEGIVSAGLLINTGWDGIDYKAGEWTLYKFDDELDKKVYDRQPFCYAFALSTMEHDKSTSYSNVRTILFDEFLTRSNYLVDEFTLFMNTISTIIRYRDDVKIYMCANTVNKSAPYFAEMGLKHVSMMKPGTIDLYRYGDSGLTVAVEYCGSSEHVRESKPSDKYFAFENPKLQMITGGAWEMNVYPHCPMRYRPKDVRKTFFIIWEEDILQCEIVYVNKVDFMFIHRKTTPIQDEDKDLIFSVTSDPRRNWRRNILKPYDKIGQTIASYFNQDRVYYQNNEIGEIVRNYLMYCSKCSIIKT